MIVTENGFMIGRTSGKYCKPIVKATEYTLTSAMLVVLSVRVSPDITRKGYAGFNVYTLGPQKVGFEWLAAIESSKKAF